ncbi:uncharacterized protein LOC114723476 [Neltuma alba]|uniref:uncharacterized protein LOC114723476 n=1 Tax=Neltuma alba TaxID=207710 RepID=UPI0010A35658|nr:uncharacterized protein LOC114723476 [Prosopis alba]
MEEVLLLHINQFKKVIAIFSASDHWVLQRYLVSGLFGVGSPSRPVGQQPEYCLLTSSGRKFMTLLQQAIVEDISPLTGLKMGSSVISGLTKLFSEYVTILERALTYDTGVIEKDTFRIKPAESVSQQVSILANLSTLVQFLSIMAERVFRSTVDIGSNSVENHSVAYQHAELDDFVLSIEESSNKLRHQFCQQFIFRVLSPHRSHEITLAAHDKEQCDANTIPNLMPSGVLQFLFLEMRKLEQLAEGNVLEVDWLTDLLREMMESIFIWVSQNKNILGSAEENTSSEHDDPKQFVLDVQFLMEIAMYGGYFSNDPLVLLSLMKSTFHSAGLDPFRDVDNDGWTIDAATWTIQMLLEIEKTNFPHKEHVVTLEEALHEADRSAHTGAFSQEEDSYSSENDVDTEEDEIGKDVSEIAIDSETVSPNMEESLGLVERERDFVDKNTRTELENTEYEKETDAEHDGILSPASPGASVAGERVDGPNIGTQGTEDSVKKVG